MVLRTILLSLLLLQAPNPNPSADTRFVDWFVRLLPIAISAYALFSGRSREDRKQLDKAVADLVLAREKHEERITGLQLQHERAMESLMERLKDHDGKLNDVGRLREDFVRVSTRLEDYGKRFDRLENKIDSFMDEIRKHQK